MKMGNWSKKEMDTLKKNMEEYLKVIVCSLYGFFSVFCPCNALISVKF